MERTPEQSTDHLIILVEFVGALIFVKAAVLLALSLESARPAKRTMASVMVAHICLLLLFAKHWITGIYKDMALCQVPLLLRITCFFLC
jgi:hypothetical protein